MNEMCFFFFQAEDGIRYLVRSRGLGDVYKRQDRGDEEQVVLLPGCGTRPVGARALLQHQVAEDAAQHHYWHAFALELHEEDAERLAVGHRPQLVDRLDLGRVRVLQPQLRGRVLEGQLIEAIRLQGPIEFLFQVAHQLSLIHISEPTRPY